MQFPTAYRRRLQVGSSEDMISRMPENVITNILDRLPLQEAVRTSILSRNWRFTWTLLTQLVFDDKFFSYLLSKNQIHVFYKRNLGKVLLQLRGSITNFVLYIPAEEQERKSKKEYNVMYADILEDINHWILFLSTKGLNKFTLINMRDEPLKLPNHLFSCLELKHLELRKCCLHPLPGFHFFPKLLGFDFHLVTFESCKYGEFISRCLLLEDLDIKDNTSHGEVKLDEIAKLVNLKRLSLWLSLLGDTAVTSSDILQLIGSLPKLEKLGLSFGGCRILNKAGASMRLSANMHCLKTLALTDLHFEDNIIECACDLINGLPDLEALIMTPAMAWIPIIPRRFSKAVSIKGNLQLRYMEFKWCKGSAIEVQFIESLLAYCPLLNKMVIQEWSLSLASHQSGRCSEFVKKLLKLHRASPIAEIHLR